MLSQIEDSGVKVRPDAAILPSITDWQVCLGGR
jgi:hypothetical protein